MPPTLEQIKSFVQWWNVSYPLDRWWREKHSVAFNSAEHRAMSFVDMKLEFEEDILYVDLRRRKRDPAYIAGRGDWLRKRRPVKMSEGEIDDLFDRFDPTSYKRNDDGKIIL